MRIVYADGAREYELLKSMGARAGAARREIAEAAGKIMDEVEREGYPAVERFSLRFDGARPCEVPAARLDEALDGLEAALAVSLRRAAENIRRYHEKMLVKSWRWEREDGVLLGQDVRGLSRVGLYVPGGTAAYPSSVLMNAVPARVAGVGELVMVTPPTENLNDAVLAAAKIAGVDRVIAVGGAQAIAALTFGAGFIPRVDKIVGPGNAYVAAAKRLAYGRVDIDMVAGPSEVLVLADGAANSVWVASDLLSQAEHDRLAAPILVTTSAALASAVDAEVERQLAALPRAEIARAAAEGCGAIVVCETMGQAVAFADAVAPEHLEILTEHPEAVAAGVKNAGAVFLGPYTPEPVGDYMAGPCHVLPTSGTARFFSPLSTDSFLKKTSVLRYGAAALTAARDDIVRLARAEGLEAHARSVAARFQEGETV
ncbi:MAG TPA: histidinol dehydrogenase [Oscillospiraceae bacterium]|nr:histidinol dehydrogenase [Oscillospiraceae bacterium]